MQLNINLVKNMIIMIEEKALSHLAKDIRAKIKSLQKQKTPCVFTSHTIIEYLIQKHGDHYLQDYIPRLGTALYHGRIGQLIRNIAVDELHCTPLGPAWSKNIRDNFSPSHAYYTRDLASLLEQIREEANEHLPDDEI